MGAITQVVGAQAMQVSVILFFSAVFGLLSLIIGFISGWYVNDVVYALRSQDQGYTQHPEMYDDNGVWINEELYSVKFVQEDDDEDDNH